jgi:hypothetical protein
MRWRLRRSLRCHDTATRPTLVAVETEDAQVRGVVASAVLTLDDVVDTEWVLLASWMAAVRAQGMSSDHLVTEPAPRRAVRHTYASFSIAAGVSLFALARRMGTSVEQLDKTYGHPLPDAVEYERGPLNAFDSSRAESFGH